MNCDLEEKVSFKAGNQRRVWFSWIPDYRLTGKLNPDKTFETPELSGLMRVDCIQISIQNKVKIYLTGPWVNINPFCSSCLKFFFFGETHLNMLKLFLKKKKKFLSSGSVFTKCETGVRLKLLTSISSEFLLYNKKFFFEPIKNLSFYFQKKIQAF